MTTRKVTPCSPKGNTTGPLDYDHYVALDWSMLSMAIGHLRPRDAAPQVWERPTHLVALKEYLQSLKGTTVLTFEETTTAHWLFVELRDCVHRIIICNPYKNRLLSDGPKTDKIDAGKLVTLLRAGLLTEVFHSDDQLYDLRLLVSAYTDLVRAGVRLQNQRSALERGHSESSTHAPFILEHLDKAIALYSESKEAYVRKFHGCARRIAQIRGLLPVHGVGIISAVTIVAVVVDAHRFAHDGKYHSYCGLIKHQKISGGRLYGKRKPQYSHTLKAVYKIAALAAIQGDNPIREYYESLLAKGFTDYNARHQVARYLATVTYGVLKTGTPYDPYRWRKFVAVA